MFIGLFHRHLETKGRLAIPKRFRRLLKDGGVLTRGLDGCLFLFTQEKWSEIVKKLATMPLTSADARSFTRLLSYEAFEVDFDNQGRILVPEVLKKSANLIKKVVIAGGLERVEIWDEQRFVKYQEKIEKDSEKIAERLTHLEIKI